jgi:hypothetical protein
MWLYRPLSPRAKNSGPIEVDDKECDYKNAQTHFAQNSGAFAIPVCHHCPEADSFGWHREGLCGKLSIMQTALACNLNAIGPENLHRYKDLFRRVHAAITDRRELEDGYVFRLDGDSVSLPDVAQWISFERLCCPFFTFQLQSKGGEPDCWLTLRGPDGTKAIIDQEFAQKRSV